ncbi:hypothetical protein [Longimycelium tulufanense]|uniref:hypothetical protein n=1 Tax=Longimycelium tulufanense TaxID=907463 RepID=UPI001E65D8B3|nr:hypothetical protein [Longimycelium tulufanense]
MRLRHDRAAVLAALGLATALFTGACSDGTSGGTSGHGDRSGADSSAQAGSSTSQNEGLVRLNVAKANGIGSVVTDGQGLTLYRFDKDTAKPPKSNCEGECLKAWPPVLADGSVEASGVDKSLIGTVTRSDGTKQVTLAGWPLYRFASDTAPGDVKGEGKGGAWYAAAPDGKKAKANGGGGKDGGKDNGKSSGNSGGYGY